MEFSPSIKQGIMHKKEICKLKKSFYGLRQSSRSWFERLASEMKSVGYFYKVTLTILCLLNKMTER